MTLVATPGAVDANSYLSDAEFLDYGTGSLASARLASSTEDTRERALRTATRMIDRLPFKGHATTYAQALQWPRMTLPDPDRDGYLLTTTDVPRRVREACAEIALALLAEGQASPDGSVPAAQKYTRAKVDAVEVEYRQGGAAATDAVGLMRRYPAAQSLLAPLLTASGAMQAVRA